MSDDMNAEQGGSTDRPDQASGQIGKDQSRLVGATEGGPLGQNSLPEAQDTQESPKNVNLTVTDGSVPGDPGAGVPPTDAGHGETGPKKHTRRNILRGALGVGIAGGLAAVGVGISKGGGERPRAIANPATKVPTATEQPKDTPTPEPTKKPMDVPKDTPTTDPDAGGKEDPIETSTPVETETPAPVSPERQQEVEAMLEKYYMPIAKESISIIGNTYSAVSQPVYDRTSCEVSGVGKKDCPVKGIYANPEFPDSGERIEEAYVRWGFYKAWVNLREDKLSSQSSLLPEEGESKESKQNKRDEFWERIQVGEDFRFPITGYGEDGPETFGKEHWVNPINGVGKVVLPSIDDALIRVSDGFGINYSVIDGHLIIGSYNGTSEGQIYKDWPGQEHRLSLESAGIAGWEIILLGDASIMEQLKTQGKVNILDHDKYTDQQIETGTILVPDWEKLSFENRRSVFLSR